MDSRTVAFTGVALLAFASNSLLTRLALGSREIDAASFTTLRLTAGAVALVLVARLQTGGFAGLLRGGFKRPLALLLYAAPFSFAYLRIGAAVGALVLFGVVQLTMIGYGLLRGERPSALSWLGIVLAGLGLVLLTAPSEVRPDPLGTLLMAAAGVAWAGYTVAGRGTTNATVDTAQAFLVATPVAALVGFALSDPVQITARGLGLGLLCGAVTSGLGYAVWYRALGGLSVTQAAVAQLSVPVFAALGGVALLGERLSLRFSIAATAVIVGVGIVLSARARHGGGPRLRSPEC